jgi:hypothetical protein
MYHKLHGCCAICKRYTEEDGHVCLVRWL